MRAYALRLGVLLVTAGGCLGSGTSYFGNSGGGSGGGGGGNCTPTDPTAEDIQAKVFKPSCALSSSCHSSLGHKANLDLSSISASCAGLTKASCEFPDRMRVVLGDPDSSVLVQKLVCPQASCDGFLPMPAFTCRSATTNDRMPRTDNALDSCRIEAIKQWIRADLTGCPSGIDGGAPDGSSDASPGDAPSAG
jgi:hypothetical protein